MRTYSYRRDLPPESKVIYDKSFPYDAVLNEQILDIFKLHRKSFRYEIQKYPDLLQYIMRLSYPLDHTGLSIETRMKWVIDQMTSIPCCKTCGRQIDFQNVKFSHDWPQYCCSECSDNSPEILRNIHIRNKTNMFNKMKNMRATEIMFDLQEFMDPEPYHKFKCRCRLCDTEFYSVWDQNFYKRSNHLSYFRCPKCYPLLNRRRSKAERDIERFVRENCDCEVVAGCRKIIAPYEIDIFIPSKNIGIEYNGSFWHSVQKSLSNYYVHLMKTEMCEQKGIRLIHIWEDEWLCDPERIKNIIIDAILGNSVIHHTTEHRIVLDRSKFNKVCIPDGYEVIDETPISIVKRIHKLNDQKTYDVADCGNLVIGYVSNRN